MSEMEEHFLEVAHSHRRCFWMDGGGAREWSGRRSMIGWLEPDEVSLSYDRSTGLVTRHTETSAEVLGDDPFAALQRELEDSEPDDHWFGYFGYAARPDLPARGDAEVGGAGLPDAVWMRCRNVRFFAHDTDPPPRPSRSRPVGVQAPSGYRHAYALVQEHLRAGNSYEVNLTHRLTVEAATDPAEVYLTLRALNPAPYAGFLQHDLPDARAWLLSSSPERFALITGDRVLETKPIKGTTPRSDDAEIDGERRDALAREPKFRAENLMIVDLLRNDLSRVCRPGTVEVPELMEVESYATVHQLVSTVRGDLRDDVSTVAALRALFPAGSMTGAPKLRTMQIIDEVEATPRGVYAGAFGWVNADGRADLGVVIRSVMTTGDGRWTLGTGGGITVQSDVDEEWAETEWKAERLLHALRTPRS